MYVRIPESRKQNVKKAKGKKKIKGGNLKKISKDGVEVEKGKYIELGE